MDISFRIQGNCNVLGADHDAPIEEVKTAIEECLMENIDINATITISDYTISD